MEDKERKRLLEEMDRRTVLWGGMRKDAKRRIETGNEKAIAKIDLRVAEDALKRIENKKKEIRGETAHKLLSEQPTRLFKRVPEKENDRSIVNSRVAKEKKEDTKNAI